MFCAAQKAVLVLFLIVLVDIFKLLNLKNYGFVIFDTARQ